MAEVVLRVRLTGGDHMDVTYEGSEADPDAAIEQVIAALAQDSGLLRTKHGDRLVVLSWPRDSRSGVRAARRNPMTGPATAPCHWHRPAPARCHYPRRGP